MSSHATRLWLFALQRLTGIDVSYLPRPGCCNLTSVAACPDFLLFHIYYQKCYIIFFTVIKCCFYCVGSVLVCHSNLVFVRMCGVRFLFVARILETALRAGFDLYLHWNIKPGKIEWRNCTICRLKTSFPPKVWGFSGRLRGVYKQTNAIGLRWRN